MRCLLKVEIPHETCNQLMVEGRFAPTMQSILSELKPESAYFATENGKRCGYIVVTMNDASEMPRIAEPFFIAFNADVHISPVMVAEDLHKAGPDIERAAKAYGKLRQPALAH